MKKPVSIALCFAVLLVTLSACTQKQTDLKYVINLTCESEDFEWRYQLQNEGVITVSQSLSTQGTTEISYVYLLEAIGEGETKIEFSKYEVSKNILTETVIYRVSVDKDYLIKAQMISDELIGENDNLHIDSNAEAQKAVEEALVRENPDYEGRLFFETQKSGDGYAVRVFLMTENEEENTVLKYIITYTVLEDAQMYGYTEEHIEDRLYNGK